MGRATWSPWARPCPRGASPSVPPHPDHLHGHPQPHDWPQITQGFEGVNVEEYIKHDFDMDSMAFGGYNSGVGGPPQGDENPAGQYPPPVSVAPPWVR